jgi:hypothetical protein
MYLLTQHKNGISALSLRRQLGVSYNTAWLMKHKLMQVMIERDADRPLSGNVQVDDAYGGGDVMGAEPDAAVPARRPSWRRCNARRKVIR